MAVNFKLSWLPHSKANMTKEPEGGNSKPDSNNREENILDKQYVCE